MVQLCGSDSSLALQWMCWSSLPSLLSTATLLVIAFYISAHARAILPPMTAGFSPRCDRPKRPIESWQAVERETRGMFGMMRVGDTYTCSAEHTYNMYIARLSVCTWSVDRGLGASPSGDRVLSRTPSRSARSSRFASRPFGNARLRTCIARRSLRTTWRRAYNADVGEPTC